MHKRVAIIETAMIPGTESGDHYLEQLYRMIREVLDKTGLSVDQIGTVVSATSDIFHGGISCANSYYWDSGGAWLKNASRNDGESLTSLFYAVMRILSGHFDTALVFSVCKGSENPDTDMLTHFFADPLYHRQLGLNETMAAGLQMRCYLDRYGITEEDCAGVVVKNLANALGNPCAHIRKRVSVEEVMSSERVMDPLKQLECGPRSDGMVAMILAGEETALRLTDKPVWIAGFGSSLDKFFPGDRDLLQGQLAVAAKQAYDMAGIKDPRKELDVVELTEPYAFQEFLWCEQLGLCEPGKGAQLLKSGATSPGGDMPVNPSGGVLAMNPYVSRGLYRLAEVVLQIKGRAGEHQLDRLVKRGLAHGTQGFCGQYHAVAIVEGR